MSPLSSSQPPAEQDAHRKKDEDERVSADEILENAVELGEYAVLDVIGEGAGAVGEFIAGLVDFG